MNHLPFCFKLLITAVFILQNPLFAEEKSAVGKIEVAVYYATNGDPSVAGDRLEKISNSLERQLQKQDQLDFLHYRKLGKDQQSIYRSYENWAEPLKPSDEVLVRFEVSKPRMNHAITLDLEFWFTRKKVLKTDLILNFQQPLYILGPSWRGGYLILEIKLVE